MHVKAEQPDLKLSLMTLTVKNRESLEECKEHISKSFKRINQRRKEAKSGRNNGSEFVKMVGGAFSFEIKRGKNSKLWHVHLHGLVMHRDDFTMSWDSSERQWVPGSLRDEWYAITGDSFHVHVRPFKDQEKPEQDICEVTSYAMKFSTLSTPDLLHAYLVFSGARLLRFYGELYNLKIPSSLTEELLQDELPYVDLMYRFFYGSGYSLEKSERGVQGKEEKEDPRLLQAKNRRESRERLGVVS
jgi:hypothetical protein